MDTAQYWFQAGDYQIERSLRFNSADSAYLNRTPASAGNRKTWSVSFWLKRSALGTYQMPFSCYQSTGGALALIFNTDNTLEFYQYNAAYQMRLVTSQVFRDPSSWYHFVFSVDTTQATASNRVKIYVNGTQITAFSTATYPTQNDDLIFNYAQAHAIGMYAGNNQYYFDGLITEFHFIDGQALTPSSFGETDTITGVWKPKKYTGTYGTNGFYLNFADNSGTTSTTLGKDSSGNGNNWTLNNFSVTAGSGNDSLIDTPTPYADGGNGRGNYCTLNPLDRYGAILSNGNLDYYMYGQFGGMQCSGNWGMTTGKWYWECTMTDLSSFAYYPISFRVGMCVTGSLSLPTYSIPVTWNMSGGIGTGYGTVVANGFSYTTGDILQLAFDQSSGKLWTGKNGTWSNSGNPAAGTGANIENIPTSILFSPAVDHQIQINYSLGSFNFGQRSFSYTPPAGFLALNTQNLPEPSIKKPSGYMDVALDTGANILAAAQSKLTTGADLIWIKDRANGNNHQLIDTVRGGTLTLQSNTTGQETTYSAPSGSSVAWCWDKGATPGFDIVTYTGNGTNRTIAHSLGVAPSMLFIKKRTGTTGYTFSDWVVWHTSIPATNILLLSQTWASTTETTVFNSTAPTSSVFSLGTNTLSNENTGTFVAYLWSEVAGFSKFGSYTGNGSSDGPFVCCGFRPRWVMIKRSNSTGSWYIYDTARETYNLMTNELCANLANAENPTVNTDIDVLSSGLKLRGGDGDVNYSGHTYIFAAFAESPFKYSLAR